MKREDRKRLESLPVDIEDKEEKIEETIEEEEKKESILKKIIIRLFILIILIAIYSIYIEPKLLFKVNEYGIYTNKIDDKMNGLKIVEIADIHYGTTINKKELYRVIKKINLLKPDIIVYTGDLYDKNLNLTNKSINDIKKIFNKLNTTTYKYAIYGDNDYKYKDKYISLMNNINFTILDNNSTLLFLDSNTPIEIIGINKYDKKDYSFINNPIDEIDTSKIYKIVLDHEVDNIDNYINYKPDLILTSHSLGGLINIPFIGRIINDEGAKKYKENYTKIDTTKIYNSNGLGTSNIKIRFNNIPSINFYRIYKR